MNWRILSGLPGFGSAGRLPGSFAVLAIAGLLTLNGCASKQVAPAEDQSGAAYQSNDPIEPVNRVMWKVDTNLDRYLLRPVAVTYRDIVPHPLQTGISNILHLLKSPIVLANDLLEGNGPRAGATAKRIVINAVFGIGGLFDVAAHQGIPYHDSDFGLTLGVWGVAPGPYLVLPFLGPSDPRDLAGYGADTVLDPFSYGMRELNVGTEAAIAQTGASVISDRAKTIDELDDLQRNSLDYYAAVRSLYQQKRASDIEAAKDHSIDDQTSAISGAIPGAGPRIVNSAMAVDAWHKVPFGTQAKPPAVRPTGG